MPEPGETTYQNGAGHGSSQRDQRVGGRALKRPLNAKRHTSTKRSLCTASHRGSTPACRSMHGCPGTHGSSDGKRDGGWRETVPWPSLYSEWRPHEYPFERRASCPAEADGAIEAPLLARLPQRGRVEDVPRREEVAHDVVRCAWVRRASATPREAARVQRLCTVAARDERRSALTTCTRRTPSTLRARAEVRREGGGRAPRSTRPPSPSCNRLARTAHARRSSRVPPPPCPNPRPIPPCAARRSRSTLAASASSRAAFCAAP